MYTQDETVSIEMSDSLHQTARAHDLAIQLSQLDPSLVTEVLLSWWPYLLSPL
jgi:hypothetical protein